MPLGYYKSLSMPPYKHVRSGQLLNVTTPAFIAQADEVLHAIESLPVDDDSSFVFSDGDVNGGISWGVGVDGIDPAGLSGEQLEAHVAEVRKQLDSLRMRDIGLSAYYDGFADESLRIIDGIASQRDKLAGYYRRFIDQNTALEAARAARAAKLEGILADAVRERDGRKPMTRDEMEVAIAELRQKVSDLEGGKR